MKQHPIVIGMCALALAGSFAIIGVNLVAQTDIIKEQNTLIGTLSGDSRALREQVKATGETPVAPAPSARAEDAAIDAPANGVDGLNGSDGRDATPADIAESLNIYCAPRNGCIGAEGAASNIPGATGDAGASVVGESGSDGKDGTDGMAGADSTVPGPAGPSGPEGRGIADVSCAQVDGEGTAIRFTYTDATFTDVKADCVVPQQ